MLTNYPVTVGRRDRELLVPGPSSRDTVIHVMCV